MIRHSSSPCRGVPGHIVVVPRGSARPAVRPGSATGYDGRCACWRRGDRPQWPGHHQGTRAIRLCADQLLQRPDGGRRAYARWRRRAHLRDSRAPFRCVPSGPPTPRQSSGSCIVAPGRWSLFCRETPPWSQRRRCKMSGWGTTVDGPWIVNRASHVVAGGSGYTTEVPPTRRHRQPPDLWRAVDHHARGGRVSRACSGSVFARLAALSGRTADSVQTTYSLAARLAPLSGLPGWT